MRECPLGALALARELRAGANGQLLVLVPNRPTGHFPGQTVLRLIKNQMIERDLSGADDASDIA